MRFTPTSRYLAAAKAAHKDVRWRVYFRHVTVLDTAIDTGTWIEATTFIDGMLPAHGARIEREPGVFIADGITITGRDIAWWKRRIFSAGADEYIECKVQFELGMNGSYAADTVHTFAGFLPKRKQVNAYNETDTVEFSVYSVQDIGQTLPAELIATQYLDPDETGGGPALILDRGIYVKNAAVTSYHLRVGSHVIAHTYDAAHYLSLDGGATVQLTADNTLYTLTSEDGTQKVQVYVTTRDLLTVDESSWVIIVVTEGTTLPKQWPRTVSTSRLLQELFAQLGIDETWCDRLEYTVAPSPAPGIPKVSYLDVPPADEAVTDKISALAADASHLWVGVADKLYKRTMVAGLEYGRYELIVALEEEGEPAGTVIKKLMYNARNNHLWLYYGDGTKNYIRRYAIATETLSASVQVGTTGADTWQNCMELIDMVIEAGYRYGLVYMVEGDGVYEIDNATLTNTQIFEDADFSPAVPALDFMHTIAGTNKIRLSAMNVGSDWGFEEIEMEVGGTWAINAGAYGTGESVNIRNIAYNPNDDRLYWESSVDANHVIRSCPSSNVASQTINYDIPSTPDSTLVGALLYCGIGVVGTFIPISGNIYAQLFDDNNVVTIADGRDAVGLELYYPSDYDGMPGAGFESNGYLGSYHTGTLWSIGTNLHTWVNLADFTGMTVTDAINELLRGFIFTAKTSPEKRAFVFRRATSAGEPQTTGNTLAVSIAEADALAEKKCHHKPADIMIVTNGVTRYTFNGTGYQSEVLLDRYPVTIDNQYIPDNIVQDLCYAGYQYFKDQYDLYPIRLGNVPLYQFEPFDGAALTFEGTYLERTASGVIHAVQMIPPASMQVEVLIKEAA